MSNSKPTSSSEYQCSSCGREYSFKEHRQLDRAPADPDEDDPMKGQGYVRVCECGHRFHIDDWQVITETSHDGQDFKVSTVHLNLNHGHGDKGLWYETCVFWDAGSYVVDRYETQDEAEDGHERIVSRIRNGQFEVQDTQFASISFPGDDSE